MFALFPYLSIYLQDVLGYSPLGAGLRFLPLTAFVFAVPLATHKLAARAPMWLVLSVGLTLIAVSLLLMYGLTAGSAWTALLAGLMVSGVGIGLANPAIAASALRVVDPARTGMASGINNAFRLTGVAMGVAALGSILERRAATSLSHTLGPPGRGLAEAVSSTGVRAAGGHPAAAHASAVAFVSGLNTLFLIGCGTVAIGALAAAVLMRSPAPAVAPATE
jgi:hypothetical protein